MDAPTVRSRIVLHLYDCLRHYEDKVFPLELTQLGTSRALGIGRNHAGVELNRLILDGYVEAGSAWVKGEKGKRKVYTLTPLGRDLAEVVAEVSGADLRARRVGGETQQRNWLIEMDTLVNKDRPKAPAEHATLTLNRPEQ